MIKTRSRQIRFAFPSLFILGETALCVSQKYIGILLTSSWLLLNVLALMALIRKLLSDRKSQGSNFLYLKNKNRSLCGVNLMNVKVISQ